MCLAKNCERHEGIRGTGAKGIRRNISRIAEWEMTDYANGGAASEVRSSDVKYVSLRTYKETDGVARKCLPFLAGLIERFGLYHRPCRSDEPSEIKAMSCFGWVAPVRGTV